MNCPTCLSKLIEVEKGDIVLKYDDERVFYCTHCQQVFPEEDFLFNTEDPC